jgi:hypothetical protein
MYLCYGASEQVITAALEEASAIGRHDAVALQPALSRWSKGNSGFIRGAVAVAVAVAFDVLPRLGRHVASA